MIQVQEPVRSDGQYDGVEPRAPQVQHRLEYGRVFGGERDDPVAPAVPGTTRNSPKGEVARLRGSRREYDLVVIRVDQARDSCSCVLDRARRFPTEAVVVRVRIAEQFTQERHHRLAYHGVDGCRGLIIQVDGHVGHSVQSQGNIVSLSAPMSRPAAMSL